MSGAAHDIAELGRPASRIFTVRDGLPQNTVQTLAFDQRGYLWAGTQDGAARYNGRVWLPIPMPNRKVSNFVGAIASTRDGAVWFGTNGGGVIRLHRGRWNVYTTASGDLPNDQVRCLVETSNRAGEPVLWAGTRAGLACLSGGVWRVFADGRTLPNDVVRAVLHTVDRDGTRTLLVGTRGGLAVLKGRDPVEVVDASTVLPHDVVTCLLETVETDGTRALWVGTERGLAVRRHGRWDVVDDRSGLVGDSVSSLAATHDAAGRTTVWVGTDAGLSRFADGRWRSWGTDDGLPSNVVMSILPSSPSGRSRSLWVGSMGSGLARVELGRWRALGEAQGLSSKSVWSVLDTDGSDGKREFWLGTLGGGAFCWRDGWTVHDTSTGMSDNVVTSLLASKVDGRRVVLAGLLGGGLNCWDGERWSIVEAPDAVMRNAVLALLETNDPGGSRSLWVGTNGGGLARVSNGGWTVWYKRSGLSNNVVVCLLETHDGRDSTIWAGTNGGGLCRLSLGAWTVIDASSGLPNNLVMGLAELRDDRRRTLWAGTEGGGVAWCDLDNIKKGWSTLSSTSTPAISSDVVYQILRDRRGRIYLFTNRGVDRLTPRASTDDNAAEFDAYAFTVDDGLPVGECNSGAALVDRSGRIWTGTGEGAAVLDPHDDADDDELPTVRIERARIDGRDDDVHRGETVAHDENDLTFEYALTSFFRETGNRFRTQLVGFDDEPSPWSSDWKRSYTNLPHGTYEFKVWARDYAGRVVGPASLGFRIRTAPWRSWWAYSLYTGAAAGVGYAAIQLRLDALRRRNEELERAIAERTAQLADKVDELQASERRALEANRAKSVFLSSMSHELRTPLNAILGFVQLMQRAPERGPEDLEYLGIVSRSGEHLLGLINDVLSISKIEAGKLSLNAEPFDLQLRLQGLSEMMAARAEAKGIALAVVHRESVPRYVVGDEGKLRQVLINLTGNAVKFTSSGRVELRVGHDGERASFEVIDTGEGIAESELGLLFQPFQQTASGQQTGDGTGLGLAISQRFVGLMGGEITVVSEPGRGSTFSFAVTLPAADEDVTRRDDRRVVGVEPGQEVFRMLVVDDTGANRLLLRRVLEPLGFEVREAADGREAVDRWDEWQPHLIWLDARLPVMSGIEVAREIRRRQTAPCRIVALSASAFDHDREAILAAGCDGFVAKPFTENEIFDAIAEHLGVRFVTESTEVDDADVAASIVEGLAQRLATLAADHRAALGEASTNGDLAATLEVIESIEPMDASLAADLRVLLRAYRFDDILAAL